NPRPDSFEEAPQADFEGAPLSGSVADWVKQLEADAEAGAFESNRELASKAGKHRKKIEMEARAKAIAETEAAKPKPAKKTKAKSDSKTTASKTARGSSIGASNDPRTRAAAGLNPVAGLDVSLEEAEAMSTSAVTATVEALSALIESANPLLKDGKLWKPHRPVRPEKRDGGITSDMVTDYSPPCAHPTPTVLPVLKRAKAASRLKWSPTIHHPVTSPPPSPIWLKASIPKSAARCCSASQARARPSPWPR